MVYDIYVPNDRPSRLNRHDLPKGNERSVMVLHSAEQGCLSESARAERQTKSDHIIIARGCMKMNTNFITLSIVPPQSVSLPKFLISASISNTAKLIYCCILDTITSDHQADEHGHMFTIFPIADLAAIMGKSGTTVKRALHDLEAAGLLKRYRLRVGTSSRLYALLPEYEPDTR